MLRTIITSLTVALITGLAALAYANPHAYRVLALCVALLTTVGVMLFFVWSLGAESRTDFSAPNAKNPMVNAVYALGLWLSLIALLAFLYFLQSMLAATRI